MILDDQLEPLGEGKPTTIANVEAYLLSKGWKREGEFWRDRKTTYLWETSAAVRQQQFREREALKDARN